MAVKCNECPIREECDVYNGWLHGGEEGVKNRNSAGLVIVQFDSDSVPEWWSDCPLLLAQDSIFKYKV